MKTILGLIGGGDRDEVILRTALAAAVPLSAHLDFLHVHVTAVKAARYSRVEFARGAGLRNAMDQLETKAKTFSEVAADHVREFCAGSKIETLPQRTRKLAGTRSSTSRIFSRSPELSLSPATFGCFASASATEAGSASPVNFGTL